jgi:hypothetical protein
MNMILWQLFPSFALPLIAARTATSKNQRARMIVTMKGYKALLGGDKFCTLLFKRMLSDIPAIKTLR